MLYSDEEMLLWWVVRLSETERREVLQRMIDVTGSDFANDMMDQYLTAKQPCPFSVRQLQAIRKWHHE